MPEVNYFGSEGAFCNIEGAAVGMYRPNNAEEQDKERLCCLTMFLGGIKGNKSIFKTFIFLNLELSFFIILERISQQTVVRAYNSKICVKP